MIRVATVDDHAIVREGIALFLSSQPQFNVVGQAETAQILFEQFENWKPDVVLMDLQLANGESGIEATKRIVEISPSCKVIILTSYHQDEYVFPAFAAGAFSYLLKDSKPEELASAIEKAHEGQAVFAPQVASKLLNVALDKTQKQESLQLSDREMQILKLVAQGLSNAEIAEQLFIHIKTVRTHVSNVLQKLHLRDRTQAAVHAWKTGLMQGE